MAAAAPPIAYLNSQYPAMSHTFIEREIAAVRAAGWDVRTFSVRACPAEQLRSQTMRWEFENTQVILRDKMVVASACARLARAHPAALAAAASMAAGAGYGTLKGKTWQGFYLAEAAVLHEWMRTAGLRHIHAHMANVSADVARLVSRIGSTIDGPGTWTWSLTVHGYAEFEFVEQWDIRAKIRDARGIAAVSDFTRSQLMRLSTPEQWGKMRTIRMCVDPNSYGPPAQGRGHGGPMRLVTVGRLVALKGIPLLIDAIRLLADRGVRTQTRVIGDGEDMDALRDRVASEGLHHSFELLGAVGQDDLPEHYAWADVYVLPSFIEGLPVVLMEAMATELPVVSTNISGIPELVSDDVNGLLVRPGRADLLADALERLATDAELRVDLGRQARRSVLAEFTPHRTGPAMAAFLYEMLCRKGSPDKRTVRAPLSQGCP